MDASAIELLPGTVDFVILRTLVAQPMHGYAISRLVSDQTTGALVIKGAALYQALHRLERRKLVRSSWGLSEHNRKAKFYQITAAGRAELRTQSRTLRRYLEVLTPMLAPR